MKGSEQSDSDFRTALLPMLGKYHDSAEIEGDKDGVLEPFKGTRKSTGSFGKVNELSEAHIVRFLAAKEVLEGG